MKRFLPMAVVAAAMGAALLPASASAQIVELGQTTTPLAPPVCPPNVSAAKCTIILTRSTAIETLRDGIKYPTRVRHAGKIVAFTLGLSALSSNRTTRKQYIHNLDTQFGGVTLAAVTVLRAVPHVRFGWKVIAESPYFHLEPFLGQVVQFPLDASLPVKRGDIVGLTTPTWAPILWINQPGKQFAYRQSRSTGCGAPAPTQTAQTPGQATAYGCDYPGTRIEYTATEVLTPVPPKNYVHAGDPG